MRKLIIAMATTAALALPGAAGAAATKTVNIYGSFFSPKSVTIVEGDTIRWVNRDNDNHQVYGVHGEFVSPILKPKQSWSFTFRAAGTYSYEDELHPRIKATVVVRGAPPTLTLAASTGYVVAGDKVTLTGVVSSHKAGEQVAIFYQPYPAPNPIERTVLLTTTGGAFSFVVAPSVLTTYLATWKGAYAAPTSVQVQPRLTLGRNNGWIIHAYGGHGLAGDAREGRAEHTLGRADPGDAAEGDEPHPARDVGERSGRRAARRDLAGPELAPAVAR
jgi:plastocyanin